MKKYFNSFVLICILLVGYIPYLNSIDKLAPQWFLLGVFSSVYLLIFSLIKGENLFKNFKNPINFGFLITLFFILISILYSVNKIESTIVLSRWITLGLVFFTFQSILSYKIKTENIYLIIASLSFFEIIIPFIEYQRIISVHEFTFADANYLKTFTGNKNITAASISLKLPFLIFCIRYFKKIILKIITTIFLIIGLYDLVLISSRAALLGVIIISISIIIYIIITRKDKYLLIYPCCFIFVLLISKFTIPQSKVLIQDRISTINNQDQSTNERVRFYKHGLNAFLNSPLIGTGIGTWKTESIKYDKENIQSYVVPYHMHNDFLQLAVEIGLFGLISYLSLFFFSIKILFKKFFDNKKIIFPLLLSLIIYGIDANFNFPMARPIMQVQLVLLLSLVLKIQNEKV